METISCAEIVSKLLSSKSDLTVSDCRARWWKDCVSFDYENMRSPKNCQASWIPIKFNLDGEFKEYKRIKIVGEKVYGNTKPYLKDSVENGKKVGRDSRDKIPIQIAGGDFYKFMELMNEIFTGEMELWLDRGKELKDIIKKRKPDQVDLTLPMFVEEKSKLIGEIPPSIISIKNSTIFSMIQDSARSSDGEIEKISNPFCRLNIKFDKNGKCLCKNIFDRSSVREEDGKTRVKLMLVEGSIPEGSSQGDYQVPNQDNIHKIFPSGTLIYGYFELSGVTLSPMGISCSAIAKDLAIQLPQQKSVDIGDICGL